MIHINKVVPDIHPSVHSKVVYLLCLLLSVMFFSVKSHAVVPFAITPEESKVLPPYCRGVKSSVPMHYGNHFCYGLNFINRANREFRNQKDKSFYLQKAASQFRSVIGHTEPKNSDGRYNTYLGVVSRYQADVFEIMGKTGEAIKANEASIRYLPKQTKAYIQLSNVFKRKGMLKEAREVLKRGLKQKPKSKILKRRLDKLSEQSGK